MLFVNENIFTLNIFSLQDLRPSIGIWTEFFLVGRARCSSDFALNSWYNSILFKNSHFWVQYCDVEGKAAACGVGMPCGH